MRQAIAPDGLISHISGMQKTSNRLAKTGQYASVGRAADGVVILRPAVPPKHFTQSQIEKTVDSVRESSGRFVERAAGAASKTPKAR
jgi:hypothetical protein